ncbi:sulfatase-like hydrolase/transferase, partial [Verrucomicrobiales bacterium]|nr:sulfatase-like hydrolase/transferase [Verrucomicrobiales bacterium]
MKNCFVFSLLALFSLTTIGQAQESRPNILLITIDDLNDWIGCLGGHPQARTPNMDRLAERGVLFTNAHCNAPICGPSRTSLMTGMRPSTTGCYDNNHVFSASRMAKHDLLLPRHFSANGYETVGCGKLFHGSKGTQYFQRYGPALGQGPLPETRFNVTDEGSKTKLWDWGEYPAKTEDTHDF